MRKVLLFLPLCTVFLASCHSTQPKYAATIAKSTVKETRIKKARPAEIYESNKDTAVEYHYDIAAPESVEMAKPADKALKVVDYAKTYMGTAYRYGGMSSSGMDCSGLIYLSFMNAADIRLPRSSSAIAREGHKIRKSELATGDLIFFKTRGSRTINHLGLVVEKTAEEVRFIHSSTSRGVMISSLKERYWANAYDQSRRIL